AAGDLDQPDAECLEFLVFRPGDGLRHDADHAEAERLGTDRRAKGRVSHRRHHESPRAADRAQMREEMRGPANLETTGRGQELAFGAHGAPGKQAAQVNQRRRLGAWHACSYNQRPRRRIPKSSASQVQTMDVCGTYMAYGSYENRLSRGIGGMP